LAKLRLVNSVVDSDRPNGGYSDGADSNDDDYADVRMEDSLLILQCAEAFWTCANNGGGPYGPEGGGRERLCEIIDLLIIG
jgi:hypothetical protein